MARAEATVQAPGIDGVLDLQAVETTFDAVDGAMFRNDGRTGIWLRNAGAGSHVVTAVTAQTVQGLAVADKTYTIAAGDSAFIPYLPTSAFNQPTGSNKNKVFLNSDGTQTEMRVVAIRSY